MKKFLLKFVITLLLSFSLFNSVADAYVNVKGYFKSNGTYVRSHVRSNPNALKYDNYSYKGGNMYNKTYYTNKTYNPSWYKPSWNTDPNYYKGLDIYNSTKPSYNFYTPSYNYNLNLNN